VPTVAFVRGSMPGGDKEEVASASIHQAPVPHPTDLASANSKWYLEAKLVLP